jgi:GDP-D-mannose dehydratase
MAKKALIIGIRGQDGAHPANYCSEKATKFMALTEEAGILATGD